MKKLIIVFAIECLFSCTENQNACNFGGTETVNLDEGDRLVNITWKGNDTWLLVKRDTTKPTTYTFQEKSYTKRKI